MRPNNFQNQKNKTMKYIIIVLLAALSLGVNNHPANAQSMDRDFFTVQVDGLGCPFCAYGLEKKFKELKGIKETNIEMETGIFTFTYPSEKALDMEAVSNQVDEAGYTAVSVKIERADGSIEESVAVENTTTTTTEESIIVKKEIMVAGNCGMCQARIEKASMDIEGVIAASWDKDSKILNIEFDQTQVSEEDIERKVAESGHDTTNFRAAQETYDNLPGCCQYDRAK